HAGTLDEHLAAVGDLHLDARARPPCRRRVGFSAGLQRDETGGFCGAVDLLEIDTDRAEEAERVRSEGGAAGQRPACATQSELIAHRTVDENLAERAREAQPRRHRLALGSQDLRSLGGAAEALEHPALERRGVRPPPPPPPHPLFPTPPPPPPHPGPPPPHT